jgi:sec-independent protein translocase protein TatB
MFGIDSGELLVIAVVALVVIGPKDLPRVMRVVGQFVGRARGMAKQFRSGFDVMIREAELEDMEKKWQVDNERIMREHPAQIAEEDWPEPVEMSPPRVAAPRPRTSKGPKAPPARGKAVPWTAPPPAPAPTDVPPADETQ